MQAGLVYSLAYGDQPRLIGLRVASLCRGVRSKIAEWESGLATILKGQILSSAAIGQVVRARFRASACRYPTMGRTPYATPVRPTSWKKVCP